MNIITITKDRGVATITLSRGKVNALNEEMVEQLMDAFAGLEAESDVHSIILTGEGKFFSFGFDIPEFLPYSKEAFTHYLTKFTDLYLRIFLCAKPVVAALNGHTMAGGCMLASACDLRLMVTGRAKIALNEITFGATVLAGAVEMLAYATGWKNAQTILTTGAMYTAEEAQELGLVDTVCAEETLQSQALAKALDLGAKDPIAFADIKGLLRQSVAQRMQQRESQSIQAFVEIWYSPKTQAQLAQIKVKS